MAILNSRLSHSADRSHRWENVWRERVNQSAALSGEGCRTQPPTWMSHWDSPLPNPISPFKNCHGWAASEVVCGYESTFSTDHKLFLLKHLFFPTDICSWITGSWVVSSQTCVQDMRTRLLTPHPPRPRRSTWHVIGSQNVLAPSPRLKKQQQHKIL